MIKVSKKIRAAAMIMSLSLVLGIMGVTSVYNSGFASAAEAGTVDLGGINFKFSDYSSSLSNRLIYIDFKEKNDRSFSDTLSHTKFNGVYCTRDDIGNVNFSALSVSVVNGAHFNLFNSSKSAKCTQRALNAYLKAGNAITARFYVNYVGYHESAWTGYLTINPNEDHDVNIAIDTKAPVGKILHKAYITVSDTHGSVSAIG